MHLPESKRHFRSGCYVFRRENESKDKRIVSLEEKVAEMVRKIASLELGLSKDKESINELTEQNQRLTDNNKRLIDQFAEELRKMKTTDKLSQEGKHLSLKAMVRMSAYFS